MRIFVTDTAQFRTQVKLFPIFNVFLIAEVFFVQSVTAKKRFKLVLAYIITSDRLRIYRLYVGFLFVGLILEGLLKEYRVHMNAYNCHVRFVQLRRHNTYVGRDDNSLLCLDKPSKQAEFGK
jgi:hypothetical protein